MSKPLEKRCKQYCSLYPCARENCYRSILFDFKRGTTTLEEPSITKPIRDKEIFIAYHENVNVKVNN